jgi:uncharacterized membrane protein
MTPRSSPATIGFLEFFLRLVAPLAAICFVAAVLTDWAYAATAAISYSNWSAWLLLFGLIAAGITGAGLLLSLLGSWIDRRVDLFAILLYAAGFVVEVINFMIHNRDGWTTVVPTGFILSIVGAGLIVTASWLARSPIAIGRGA